MILLHYESIIVHTIFVLVAQRSLTLISTIVCIIHYHIFTPVYIQRLMMSVEYNNLSELDE